MTKSEFEIQKNIGAVPKDAIFRLCRFCRDNTPQIIIEKIPADESPGLIFVHWQCLCCKKFNTSKL